MWFQGTCSTGGCMSPQGRAQSPRGIMALSGATRQESAWGYLSFLILRGKNWPEQGETPAWRKWPLAEFLDVGSGAGSQAGLAGA